MRSGARQRDLRARIRAFKAEIEAYLAPLVGVPYTDDQVDALGAKIRGALWRLARPRPLRWIEFRGTISG